MKENLKRYGISSIITFVGTFAVSFGALLSADTFAFTKGAVISAVLSSLVVAGRAVTKIIYEIGTYLLSSKD